MSSPAKVPELFADPDSDDALAQATPRDSAYGTAPLPSLEPSPVELGDNDQTPVQNPRKRAREDDEGGDDDDNDRSFADGSDGDDDDGGVGSPVAKKVSYVFAGQVTVPPLCVPKSQYSGYRYPMPVEKEFQVISTLLAQESDVDSNASSFDFYSYQLDNFSIYYPNCRRMRCEMAALSNLSVKIGEALMLFDGVLTDGKTRHYVEGVPFSTLSIGNYQKKTEHDVSNNIWIQTDAAARRGAWYELGSPSETYERYYTPFVWLANFAKHVIQALGFLLANSRPCARSDISDYLTEKEAIEDIELEHFRRDFAEWIKAHHSESLAFQKWYASYGRDDFRQAVAAHRDWLWNQVHITEKRMTRHRVWDEVFHIKAVEEREVKESRTIVTPYVHSCFEHIFGDTLKVVEPVAPKAVEQGGRMLMEAVVIPKPIRAERDEQGFIISRPRVLRDIKAGQVVAIRKDSGTEWTSQSNTWFAYIHHIRNLNLEWPQNVAIDVTWIYAPEDTVLSLERYPHHNELFFSDHCNCGESPLYTSDVISIVSVAFNKGPRESECEFFIRQKYRCQDPAFMTLKDEDLKGCQCTRPKDIYSDVKRVFKCGDTALVSAVRCAKETLEPVEIVRFVDQSEVIEVRVLERRHRVDKITKPRDNELLWTNMVVPITADCVYRRCYVRFVAPADLRAGKIPAPYDRHGTGDCFTISSFIDKKEGIKPFTAETFPPTFLQGLDLESCPSHHKEMISGMDLFCGGGNFGRGIEEGGVVKMKWAVDIDKIAMANYTANLRGGDKDVALYLGSINDYLQDAVLGKYSREIAAPGQVGFIIAGSPCQGFSNANQNRDSIKSIKNCSLVASVATAIDVYRPLFGLLENVPGIATTVDRSTGEENVFSQLLCCLVGLGYQCQQFTLDAWSFGNPQSRTRLFLSIAAPGQNLPDRPPRSHEHPPKTSDRALFKAPNGQKFGGREMNNPCPFPCATFRQRLGDLPPLNNNHVGICIPFPDHRNSRIEGPGTRTLITHVPKHAGGRSWRSALNTGVMPKQFDLWKMNAKKGRPHCRSWSRMAMEGLCKTITTAVTPQCAFTGTWIHPEEDRLITVMEARRAQGLPDDEVLIGNAPQAFKVVGNGVARSVALVWGLAIRNAYLGQNHVLKR